MISSISGTSSLTQSYMTQMRQQMFSKIDTNGDGKHDKDELAAMVANGPQAAPGVDEILEKFDTDGDGAINKAEFDAGHAQESGSVQASNTEEELLQALLEVLQNEDSTTSSSTDDASENNSTITNLLASLKAYMQTSVNGFAQYDETQSLLGSILYA